ncbi:MAG: tyrosine--tRNA ligase [Candidatus Liptonbacteria bacterium]|nr:tyrosine--tRNA ligase [Candidatus Liptonbacteria bacterium]
MNKKELINEALTRSVSNIMPSRESFEGALLSGEKLRIYFGVDATGPHLHLGHLTNFLWLRRMQDLGHEVILLIGDFTARIGDPTDKMAARQPLTKNEVRQNMHTFKRQVSKIISFSGKNQALIKHNSSWYKKMKLEDFMKDLLGYFTVQNMLQRDMFRERLEKWKNNQEANLDIGSIGLKEFIYPLLQGYDGVEMDVDLEIGGNDQTFNMSVGRELRKAHIAKGNTKLREKFFVATTLLVNPNTGKKLMNKSEGGLINLDDTPNDIFGKVMALDDYSMFAVAEHCTLLPLKHIEDFKKGIASTQINPRDAKIEIASAVVDVIYGKYKAEKAKNGWIDFFSKKEIPEEMPTLKINVSEAISVLDLLVLSKLAKSKSDSRRLILGGAVELAGTVKKNPSEILELSGGEILKIGKRRFFRIRV